MFYPGVGVSCRRIFYPKFCDDVHLLPEGLVLLQYIAKDFFIRMVAVDVGMIKSSDPNLKSLFD
jgi:hypothetical protein